VETFADLRTVAAERAPLFFTSGTIDRAVRLAERDGHFEADAVSPVAAAARITIPVVVIHSDADVETPPEHSRSVYAALRGPKRLLLVPDAPDKGSLRGEVWDEIERWIDSVPADPNRPCCRPLRLPRPIRSLPLEGERLRSPV
jgi:pimeloyl-ACP methyl ester carboxylesterase